jgi:hypothetical protein
MGYSVKFHTVVIDNKVYQVRTLEVDGAVLVTRELIGYTNLQPIQPVTEQETAQRI